MLAARFRGWPHQTAWFSLGRWGKPVNILALVYGGLMIINIALWPDGSLFGDFGDRRTRCSGTRSSTRSSSRSATRSTGMPAWPIFETLIGVILIAGGIYYLLAVRGRAPDEPRPRPTW